MKSAIAAILVTGLIGLSTAAHADDWVAAKLRGIVLTQQDGKWVPLQRGDVVPDARVIRTLASGNVEFTRDGETIDVFGDSQIQIHDRAGQRFTTVNEVFGKVAIEANVENVKHFAVETPFIAAVVKGTKFTVTSGADSTRVDVTRGKVGVEDLRAHTLVDVLVNQHASAGTHQSLTVGGSGTLQPITNAAGKVVSVATNNRESVVGDEVNATGSDNGKGSDGLNIGNASVGADSKGNNGQSDGNANGKS